MPEISEAMEQAVRMAGDNAPAEELALRDINLKSFIHVVRGQQVMLDSDLASLYEVETGASNRAAKRNENRFPEDFRFQLTHEETENLKCQFGTSSLLNDEGHGGRRKLPYAYTEQGIAMLSGVLRSDAAVQASINIMRAFVEMRRFIASNALLFERMNSLELKQLAFQKSTDERFGQVFRLLEGEIEPTQKVFFDGQIFDAFSFIAELVQKAQFEIILVDSYVDVNTLNILAKKQPDTTVVVYTLDNARLSDGDIALFNAQYPELIARRTKAFHDRFLILDRSMAYHLGASVKDAGKRSFAINKLEDETLVESLLQRLAIIDESSENTNSPV